MRSRGRRCRNGALFSFWKWCLLQQQAAHCWGGTGLKQLGMKDHVVQRLGCSRAGQGDDGQLQRTLAAVQEAVRCAEGSPQKGGWLSRCS